jgi:hypothetical protein
MRPSTPRHARQAGVRQTFALGLKAARAALFVLLLAAAASAQGTTKEPDELVVEGRHAGDVFAFGRTIRVRGDVRGVIAFGGDVVVEGKVEGDAATVGGSAIQQEGSFVGGDVMVLGGAYQNRAGPGGRSATGDRKSVV